MPGPGPFRPHDTAARPLAALLSVLPELRLASSQAAADVVLSGVTHASDQVRPGDLYAALPGSRHHGMEFVAEAERAGAVAVLTDGTGVELGTTRLPTLVAPDPRALLGRVACWVYGDPSSSLVVLGVTGTNGKTTTAYLLDAGLRAAGRRTGLIGTVETRIAGEVVPSVRTTPEATDLQALLAAMVERRVDAVAMEVSSHALALHRVDGTAFAVAAFTNLSQDHLDFHRDLEDYFAAKARLFTPEFARAGVIDVDDLYGRRLAEQVEIPVVRVSPAGDTTADWYATDVVLDGAGSTFVLHGPGDVRCDASTALPGRFNVADAVLALVALVTAGVALDDAVRGVASCDTVPGRMQRVDAGQPFLAVVDYAHTPDAVETLLAAVRPLATGQVIAVLGCGGDRDRGKRPLMGAALARGADIAVLTSDNPRSEDPASILAEMEDGARRALHGMPAHQLLVEPDRRRAIRLAVEHAAPGDVVVLAGKGHERTQEVGGRLLPFDDVGELRSALDAVVLR